MWMAVFHSVSAFCNAGFDILGTGNALYPSLTAYAADPLVNIVIMLLIIVGGIGFLTWGTMLYARSAPAALPNAEQGHSECDGALITSSGVALLSDGLCRASPWERGFLASLFQSVTPRTAGFNTVDLTKMTHLTGGHDLADAHRRRARLHGGRHEGHNAGCADCQRRRRLPTGERNPAVLSADWIPLSASAAAILLLYLGLTFAGAAVISAAEGLPLGACLYETASAAGTVGLTLGLTPQLGRCRRAFSFC